MEKLRQKMLDQENETRNRAAKDSKVRALAVHLFPVTQALFPYDGAPRSERKRHKRRTRTCKRNRVRLKK